jgi:hypothetical protein
VHGLGKESHRAFEAVTAKPAQHFLRTMDEENYSQYQSQYGESDVIRGVEQSFEHLMLLD